MKKKRFELDVTNCKLPDYWVNLPKIIPLIVGNYEYDFDVADETINAEVHKIPEIIGRKEIPVGVNAKRIPVGAILRRLPDIKSDD